MWIPVFLAYGTMLWHIRPQPAPTPTALAPKRKSEPLSGELIIPNSTDLSDSLSEQTD